MVGAELPGVLDDDDSFMSRHAAQQTCEQGRLSRTSASSDEECELADDDLLEQACRLGGHGRSHHPVVQTHPVASGHAQRQAGARFCQNVEDGVHARAVCQAGVHPRAAIVETSTDSGSQPNRQRTQLVGAGERGVGELQTSPSIDVDPIGSIDQHIGHAVQGQQWLEAASPRTGTSQFLNHREHRGVRRHPPNGCQRLGNIHRRPGTSQSSNHPADLVHVLAADHLVTHDSSPS